MEYQVPQFIDIENKVVGPLTLKQFIYLAGGGGISVASFVYLPIYFSLPITAVIGGFALALAFYKMNGKPFVDMVEAGFNYYLGAKMFLWKREEAPARPEAPSAAAVSAAAQVDAARSRGPRLTRGKLNELAWSLDINTGNNQDLES